MENSKPDFTKNLTQAGKGRPPGVPNKITKAAKQAFEDAFEDMGGVSGMVAWANKNPTVFYTLYSKLIPVDNRHGNPDGSALKGVILLPIKDIDGYVAPDAKAG